jgi:hypothetical protein
MEILAIAGMLSILALVAYVTFIVSKPHTKHSSF